MAVPVCVAVRAGVIETVDVIWIRDDSISSIETLGLACEQQLIPSIINIPNRRYANQWMSRTSSFGE
jgi:hypothetical protein